MMPNNGIVAAALLSFATSAAAATNERTTDKGNTANFGFDVIEQLTCEDGSVGERFTNFFFIARQNVVRTNGTQVAATALELGVSTFETCTFSFQSAFGSLNDGGTYRQNKTSSAEIAATIALFDSATGMPWGDAVVAVTLTGTGTPTKTTNVNKFASGGTTITSKQTGNFNDATATGSLTFAGVNQLALAQFVFAQIGTTSSGTMIISRVARK